MSATDDAMMPGPAPRVTIVEPTDSRGRERRASVVLVGQFPDEAGIVGGEPIQGQSLKLLLELSKLPKSTFLSLFARVNLLPECPWPAESGPSMAFPVEEARAAAAALLPHLAGRKAIFLGKNVSSAMGVPGTPWYAWHELRAPGSSAPVKACTIPHPCSLHWSDPDHRALASEFLGELAKRLAAEVAAALKKEAS